MPAVYYPTLQTYTCLNLPLNAIDGTRTRTHFLSISSGLSASLRYHALAEPPGSRTINSFWCFWNLRLRPASVFLRSILLSYNGIFKINGNETKKPPIIYFDLFIFHVFSPYPQCLIVLWVHYLNYNFIGFSAFYGLRTLRIWLSRDFMPCRNCIV